MSPHLLLILYLETVWKCVCVCVCVCVYVCVCVCVSSTLSSGNVDAPSPTIVKRTMTSVVVARTPIVLADAKSVLS